MGVTLCPSLSEGGFALSRRAKPLLAVICRIQERHLAFGVGLLNEAGSAIQVN